MTHAYSTAAIARAYKLSRQATTQPTDGFIIKPVGVLVLSRFVGDGVKFNKTTKCPCLLLNLSEGVISRPAQQSTLNLCNFCPIIEEILSARNTKSYTLSLVERALGSTNAGDSLGSCIVCTSELIITTIGHLGHTCVFQVLHGALYVFHACWAVSHVEEKTGGLRLVERTLRSSADDSLGRPARVRRPRRLQLSRGGSSGGLRSCLKRHSKGYKY